MGGGAEEGLAEAGRGAATKRRSRRSKKKKMRASERAAIVAAVAIAFEAIFLFRARPELGGRPDWPLREVVASERRGMGEVKTTEKRGEFGGVEVER